MEAILGKREIGRRTGLSERTIRRLEERGELPMRRQISPGRSGWLESEIDEYLRSRPAGPLSERTAAASRAARAGGPPSSSVRPPRQSPQ